MRGPLSTMLQFIGPSAVFMGVNFSLLCVLATIASASGPVSVTTLGGTNAQFHCNGNGTVLAWEVDGLPNNDQSIVDREITEHTVSSSGRVQSTLTVPATSENDGTTVRCFIGPSLFSLTLIGNSSTLTVLPGIGPVVNVKFSVSFISLLWTPPATAGVLSGLSYIVIVTNSTGQVIVSDTTNNTNYPLPAGLNMPCRYYTANVTAFSSQHHSGSVVTGQRVPGEYYDLVNVPKITVASLNTTQVAVTFTINTEQRTTQVCPDQDLLSVTYPTSNTDNRVTHDELPLAYAGAVNYTVSVMSGLFCACDIKIIADDITVVVDIQTVLFSSYNVQDCDVSSDQHTSSILVECTFAINSTAPGIVVIQDDQSQYTINKTLQRLLQDSDKGSVNITGLPAGEYSVRVYDNSPATDSTSAAYQHSQFIHIMDLPQPSSTRSISAANVATDTSTIAGGFPVMHTITVFPTVTPEVKDTDDSTPVIIGAVASIILLFVIILGMLTVLFAIKSYNRKAVSLAPDFTIETVFSKENENEYTVINGKPKQPAVNIIAMQSGTTSERSLPVNHESTYMEARSEYLPQASTTPHTIGVKHPIGHSICSQAATSEKTAKQKEIVYADPHHLANRPAPPPAAEPVPVQYATIQPQTDTTVTKNKVSKKTVYTDLHHSANPPAPPLLVEPVQYATVKKQTATNDKVSVEPVFTPSTKPPAPPPAAEPAPVQCTTVTVTDKKADVQLSVSTNLKNNIHVETQASYDPATLSLHTSTKTSDYPSTLASACSADPEPQTSAKLSDSKTEASYTKISGYYSDQEEYCVPKGTDGSFYEEAEPCTDADSGNAEIVNKQTTPTPGHVTEPVDDTRQHVHTCTCEKQMSVISMGVFPEVPIPMHYALYSQAETTPDTGSNLMCVQGSTCNKVSVQYHRYPTNDSGLVLISLTSFPTSGYRSNDQESLPQKKAHNDDKYTSSELVV